MSETTDETELAEFWAVARGRAGVGSMDVVVGETPLGVVPPPAWAFGDSPALADELLGHVLSGAKTACSTALWEFEAGGEPLPTVGDVSILLDGAGHPRALIRTTDVQVVLFREVDEEFAAAEGEDDGSLAAWRAGHETYFRRRATDDGGVPFSEDLPIVLEEFELRYPDPSEK